MKSLQQLISGYVINLLFYLLNWKKLGQILKCYVTPVSSPPKPIQSNPPSVRLFFFTSVQTLFSPTFSFEYEDPASSTGFSFHSSISSDTKGGSKVPLKCHLSRKKNWTCFWSKLNHKGDGLMSCAGLNNGCQKDFIMLALELSVLKGLKMQKTLYSKCMSETKSFPGIMIAVWEPLCITTEL